ncbi:Hypothetical predicted protein [Mytilus galloprovincialis]|uniref:Ankyrin repeat domain-containing protein n=1 Tax=Mytilus galloprovincialis TaxID=29158 RepID=A0A8B6CXQ7_MYTGA|nr:Hypothetical predicted protein [Mytilus galloprovincialis]
MSFLTKCKEKIDSLKNLSSASKYKVDDEEELLFASINQGNFKMSKILIDGKINVNMLDYSDSTPLITICRRTTRNQENDDIFEFVEFLLYRGANLHLTDIHGKSAFDYADGNNLKRVKELFKKYNKS